MLFGHTGRMCLLLHALRQRFQPIWTSMNIIIDNKTLTKTLRILNTFQIEKSTASNHFKSFLLVRFSCLLKTTQISSCFLYGHHQQTVEENKSSAIRPDLLTASFTVWQMNILFNSNRNV